MIQASAAYERLQSKARSALRKGRKQIYQRVVLPVQRSAPHQIVFVAGAQRSGTNMVMDMLERSYATAVFHERDERAFDNYELRGFDVLRGLAERSPAPTVVFKALCESQDISQLLNAFAPARGVWVFRHYPDVVASHIRKWSGMPDSIAEIAAADDTTAGWRGRGMSMATREFIRRCHHPKLSNASACALFWYLRNILFFEQELERNPQVKLIGYDRLVAAPAEGARELFAFAGLDFHPAVCDFVAADVAAGKSADTLDIDAPIRQACEALEARLLAVIDGGASNSEDAQQ